MLKKEEIEEVFKEHPYLKPPDEIYILDAPLAGQIDKNTVILRGATPKRMDIAFISPQATGETLVHETLHNYGLGERVVRPLARLLRGFRKIFPPIRKTKVVYETREVPVSELQKYSIFFINSENKLIEKLERRN